MSKKYSLQSSRPSLSGHAHRSRKSLDSSTLLSPAARPKRRSYPLRTSLDDHSFRKAARDNDSHGTYNGADADELQLAKQKAAAWVWHQRAVGEVVAPTKRSAIASLHNTLPPSSSSPHDSAIDAAAAGPAKSRFYTEALKEQQQEQKMQAEVHAEHLDANSTPPAPASSNKEAKLTSLYDAFEVSRLRDQMAQLVEQLQQVELQQEAAESEEPAGISSKRMMRNNKLDSGLAGMPNFLCSDINSNRMMRNLKLDSEPMDSFHSDHHDHVVGLMDEHDQYRIDGQNMQRPVAGGSLRLHTESYGGKILHQGKGNLRKPFSAFQKLFHKISKAVKGSSKGTVSHGDNELEEYTLDHAGQGPLHGAQHNYQHYHYHHHHHHYYHHSHVSVDDDDHQSEQDVNAFTEEVVFRRRLSERYVGKDGMNIKQRSANVMSIVDQSDVKLGTSPSPMRRRRHSASEGLFSDHNSPNHPVPVYAEISDSHSLRDYDQITGLGYYPARLGRSVWAYSEEENDEQTTAIAASATLSNSRMHSKLEDRKEALFTRQRRFSESFADHEADHVRLSYSGTALASS